MGAAPLGADRIFEEVIPPAGGVPGRSLLTLAELDDSHNPIAP
jgi:hypothetical protein